MSEEYGKNLIKRLTQLLLYTDKKAVLEDILKSYSLSL